MPQRLDLSAMMPQIASSSLQDMLHISKDDPAIPGCRDVALHI